MKTKQLAFGFGEGATRCSLCDRKLDAGVCKWCFKGGLGDPPCPEMASWSTWRKGLEKVLRREIRKACIEGVGQREEQQCVDAVLHDRGDVPDALAMIAMPYLERLCSEGRYNNARASALLTHRLYNTLHRAFVDDPDEPFLEKIARLNKLSRAELIEHAKQEEQRKHTRAALAWHVEDLCTIATNVIRTLRRAGVTKEQRSAIELALVVVDQVGLEVPKRLRQEDFDPIARCIVAEELGKRGRKARIAEPTPLRMRIDISRDIEAEAETEALAEVEAVKLRLRA